MDPSVRFIDDTKPMLEANLQRVRGVKGVKWAVPLYKGNGRAKLTFVPADLKEKTYPPQRLEAERLAVTGPPSNPFTRVLDALVPGIDNPATPPARWYDSRIVNVIEQVILIGVDDTSMVGAPPPQRMLVGSLKDLRRPDSVIVDRVGLRKLFPECHLDEPFEKPRESDEAYLERLRKLVESAPELEMNDHRAVIVGVCEATRTFQSNPVVYTLYSRAKQFVPMERKILSFVLAQTDDEIGPDGRLTKISPEEVADRIQRQTGLGARTSEKFTYKTIKYYLLYTGIPINFGITVFLGFLVGTAVAGQTFYNFTIENLKQFGAQGHGRFQPSDRAHDPAPGRGGGRAGLRDRRGALDRLRLEDAGLARSTERAGLLHALATAARHGRGDRAHLRAGQPAQRPARDPPGTGDRLSRLTGRGSRYESAFSASRLEKGSD